MDPYGNLYNLSSNIHDCIVYLACMEAPARRGKLSGNVCLIRNCTIPIRVHNVLLSYQDDIIQHDSIVYL